MRCKGGRPCGIGYRSGNRSGWKNQDGLCFDDGRYRQYQEAQGSSFRLMGYPPRRIGKLGYES